MFDLTAIFLDIDGVLNDHAKLPGSVYCGIDRERVRLFNVLLAETDAQIVVSSSWRYMILTGQMTVKGFEMLLLLHGVHCENRVHGHTVADGAVEDEPAHDDTEAWRTAGLRMRAAQIREYIETHEIERYVVLDDLPLNEPCLVQTDGTIGLTGADVRSAIAMLGAKSV